MKKEKLLLFLILIIALICILYYSFGISLSFFESEEIKNTRKYNEQLIDEIKINDIDTVYDRNNNVYFYSMSKKYNNKSYILNIKAKKGLKYKIIDKKINIIRISYENPIKILLYDDKGYYETELKFTNLPIVSISSNEDIFHSDVNTTFKYLNYDNPKKEYIYNSKMHIRGGSSLDFDKKSYRINYINENNSKSKSISIPNFYNGDSLILDAQFKDPSKIRNILATELWNSVSSDFSNINLYSEFVEVFINNEYKGIYVLTEPVNRSKLNLNKSKKEDTSVIIKSIGWIPYSDDNIFSINTNLYSNYEMKYPNNSELYSISWEKILSKCNKYYKLKYKSDYETIKDVWNIDNYIDLIIYNAVINNQDNNFIKNNYIYINSLKDTQLRIWPWDMEYSFGMEFSETKTRYMIIDLNDYNAMSTLFFHNNAKEINELLVKRYKELRKDILTKDYFDNLLDKYKNQLTKGASLRETEKWYDCDIAKEIEDVRTWLYNRLDYFDEVVGEYENE